MISKKCHYCKNPATGEFTLEANLKKKRKKDSIIPVCPYHENESGGRIILPYISTTEGTPIGKELTVEKLHEYTKKNYPTLAGNSDRIAHEEEENPKEETKPRVAPVPKKKAAKPVKLCEPVAKGKSPWLSYGMTADGLIPWVNQNNGKRVNLSPGERPV